MSKYDVTVLMEGYDYFNKYWLKKNYITINKINIIKDLSKNYRFDVLNY